MPSGEAAPDDKAKSGVKSLQVALNVLEAVAASTDPIGVSDIARQLGLSKPSVYRHLRTLVENQFLFQDLRTGRYSLGVQLHVLGQLASNRIDILKVSDSIMRQLRDDSAMTVLLVGYLPHGTVILRSVVGPSPVELSVRVGSKFPLHVTSPGILALAFDPQRLAAYRRYALRHRIDPAIDDWDSLDEAIAQARAHGWAMVIERAILGVAAVSVPVFDGDGDSVAALSLIGPPQSFQTGSEVPPHLEKLRAAAARMSSQLGYRGPYPSAASRG